MDIQIDRHKDKEKRKKLNRIFVENKQTDK
jgi:hypothetical protein